MHSLTDNVRFGNNIPPSVTLRENDTEKRAIQTN